VAKVPNYQFLMKKNEKAKVPKQYPQPRRAQAQGLVSEGLIKNKYDTVRAEIIGKSFKCL